MTTFTELTFDVDLRTIEIDGIDTKDYPDFCDAFVSYAEHDDGTPLTDDELEKLNDAGLLWHDQIMENLY